LTLSEVGIAAGLFDAQSQRCVVHQRLPGLLRRRDGRRLLSLVSTNAPKGWVQVEPLPSML
jgi:hypothetical protein